MKLDAGLVRYLTKVEWRVLVAVEMGMKNHAMVPVVMIARIANLCRTGVPKILSLLLKNKLLAHDSLPYDGYKLTYLGYDYLALRTLLKRGHVTGVGMRMGVGKESDIHICQGADAAGPPVILKLHRLGRISFRSIKRNRDYLGSRQSVSWMYAARLAAAKEFAYMKLLHEHGFPVPTPIDVNRHAVVMSYVEATPLCQIRALRHPNRALETLLGLIVKLAEYGMIHGDFNEFNLMLDEKEKITIIDFPQIVSCRHPNADFYFNRDVKCIRDFFRSRFNIEVTDFPLLEKIATNKQSPDLEERMRTLLGPRMEDDIDPDMFRLVCKRDADNGSDEDDEPESESGVVKELVEGPDPTLVLSESDSDIPAGDENECSEAERSSNNKGAAEEDSNSSTEGEDSEDEGEGDGPVVDLTAKVKALSKRAARTVVIPRDRTKEVKAYVAAHRRRQTRKSAGNTAKKAGRGKTKQCEKLDY